jgi:hypothetical protein
MHGIIRATLIVRAGFANDLQMLAQESLPSLQAMAVMMGERVRNRVFRDLRGIRLLLVLSVLLCGTLARALPEETWLVVIGNNRGNADEVQLQYGERDAREFAEVLRTQGGVTSDRVRLLLDEQAETVRRTINGINAGLKARATEGRSTALLVFYSGHADAESLHLRGSQLPVDELRGLLAGSAATMRILVVDACRSGAVTRVKGMRSAAEFAIRIEDRVEAEGTAMISSSTAGESSQESDRLRASFFSHHLVNALRGAADRNGDGKVTLSEAYAYSYAQTLKSSGQTLSLQHPTYSYDVKGSGDLVLTSLSGAEQNIARLRLSEAGTYLVTEEKESGSVVAELTTFRDHAVIALPRGTYFVQRRGSHEYREYLVTLWPGQQSALDAQSYRSVRYDQLVRKRGGARASVHGVHLLAGARGALLSGEGPTASALWGYSADLPWLTVGTRLRGSTASLLSMDGGLASRHYELGLSLLLQRYVDLPWCSLAFGVAMEGTWYVQRFDPTLRMVADRSSFGMGFSALFAMERQLVSGLGLRLELGPVASLFRGATLLSGEESGSATRSVFTWWLAAGGVWRF